MKLKDLLNANRDNLLDFYNKAKTGDKAMDDMNRWFYVDGIKHKPIEKIDEGVLEKGNVDSISNGWGQTLMTAAVINGRIDLVELLLKYGARADSPNFFALDDGQKGQTPLQLAQERAKFDKEKWNGIVELLKKETKSPIISVRDGSIR